MSLYKNVKWAELFKKEFEERIMAQPVVYLPMGICEPHGHIAVLGLDTLKAEYLCEEAASRWGGIVAPSQGYQIHETGYHAPWLTEVAGNVNTYMTSMPPAPMLYFFLYQLRAFHNAGFKLAVVITGHAGGNQEDFRLAAQLFMQKTDMMIEVFSDPELTNGKYTGDHAGKYEISQLMYLKSEYVKLERLNFWNSDLPETRFAQGPDANEATKEYGRQILEDCLIGVNKILDKNSFGDKLKVNRQLMLYGAVEKIWVELRSHSKNWVTGKLKKDQEPSPGNSQWKPFEYYSV
ncbi:MAG: creatininase family protein [Daejeonella sp.]